MRRSLKLVRLLRRLGTKKRKSRRFFGDEAQEERFPNGRRVPECMGNTVRWKRHAGPVCRSLKLDQVYKVDEEKDKVLRNVLYMSALCAAL